MNARTLASLFYVAENGNVCIKADEPDTDTVKAMVFAADQSGLGWDFAYEAVRDALQFLADTDDDEPLTADRIREQSHEFADAHTDVYTADLVKWLASAPLQHGPLCDEAAEELGDGSYLGLEKHLQHGQYEAYQRALDAVADNWEDEEEETDDGDEDA